MPKIQEMAKKSKTIIEVGVNKANTTQAILKVIEGQLISIDKNEPVDFTSDSPNWTFIKSDVQDVEPQKCEFLLVDCDPKPELFKIILAKIKPSKFLAVHDCDYYGLTDYIMDWGKQNKFKLIFYEFGNLGFIALQKD